MKKVFLFVTLFVAFLNASTDLDKENHADGFYVKVDGAEIFCKMIGKGDPIFVIQGGPGISCDGAISVFSKLAEKNTVLFFDHRASARSTGEINYETMRFDVIVKDVETIRETLGFSKIGLIGDCWGGNVAMRYAIAYPENVDKFILLSPFPASLEYAMPASREFLTRLEPDKAELRAIKASEAYGLEDPEALLRVCELNQMPHFYNSEKATSFVRENRWNLKEIEGLAAMRNMFTQVEYSKYYDWHRELRELKHESLIICGDDDWVPLSSNEKIHESLSNSKLLILKDCGHKAIHDKSDEVCEAAQGFFGNN